MGYYTIGCSTSANDPAYPYQVLLTTAHRSLADPVPILLLPERCPCLTIVTRFVLKIDSRKWFMLGGQQQTVGQQAGAAAEGAFGRDPGQFRKIIAFRQMREDDVGGLAVVARSQGTRQRPRWRGDQRARVPFV